MARASQDSSSSIAAAFLKPGTDAKPMARMWFPDAGTGKDADSLKVTK